MIIPKLQLRKLRLRVESGSGPASSASSSSPPPGRRCLTEPGSPPVTCVLCPWAPPGVERGPQMGLVRGWPLAPGLPSQWTSCQGPLLAAPRGLRWPQCWPGCVVSSPLFVDLSIKEAVSHISWDSGGGFLPLRSWLIPDKLLDLSEPAFSSVV